MPDLNTLLDDHVVLKYESVDRVFLNGYVAKLQEPDQLAWFLGQHRGEEVPRVKQYWKLNRALRTETTYPAGPLNLAWRNFDAQLGALLSEARMAA